MESTTPQKAKTEETPAEKGLDLDFDPVEMVIYAEIMKPGYEKY